MKKTPIVIRIILTLVLLWFVFKETGPFTALSMGLVFAAIEAITFWMQKVNDFKRTEIEGLIQSLRVEI